MRLTFSLPITCHLYLYYYSPICILLKPNLPLLERFSTAQGSRTVNDLLYLMYAHWTTHLSFKAINDIFVYVFTWGFIYKIEKYDSNRSSGVEDSSFFDGPSGPKGLIEA